MDRTKITNDYFVHLRLTDILNIHEVQSILLKFWFLAYCFDQTKQGLAKKITFQNCFIFEMDVEQYQLFFLRINQALSKLISPKNINLIINEQNANNVRRVTYENFGMHFLQILGNTLRSINENELLEIIRKAYFAMTIYGNEGQVSVKSVTDIVPIPQEEVLTNLSDFQAGSPASAILPVIDSDRQQQDSFRRMSRNSKQLSSSRHEHDSKSGINAAEDEDDTQTAREVARYRENMQPASVQQSRSLQVQHSSQQQKRIESNNLRVQTSSTNRSNRNIQQHVADSFQPYNQRLHPVKFSFEERISGNSAGTANGGLNGSQYQRFPGGSANTVKRRSVSTAQNFPTIIVTGQQEQTGTNSKMRDRFEMKISAIQDNNRTRSAYKSSFSACYPCEEKMKKQPKANLSAYMLGGYDIVDYSDTINQLHRKLLRKIVLNR